MPPQPVSDASMVTRPAAIPPSHQTRVALWYAAL